MTLEQIRRDVGTAVDVPRKHGDADLHLLNGLDVMGPAESSPHVDGLHPGAEGYELKAGRIMPVVASLLH